jgi:hypothetical protein
VKPRADFALRWAGALLGVLALAGAARALVQCQADTPAVPPALAVALALGCLGAWLMLWCGLALGFHLPASEGRRAALQGSWAWCLALAWPLARRAHLPYPHNLPERALQILVAASVLSGLALTLWSFLRAVLRSGVLGRRSPRWAALRLGGLAWIVLFGSSLWTWRWLMTGDAPTYVLMSASLVRHGSLDLAADYQGGEWRRYYPLERDLPSVALSIRGHTLSEHRPLLPVLAAPGYALGGFAGFLWTGTLLGALATALLHLLLRKRGSGPDDALQGWALLALGAPWLVFSQSAMVEVLAGLLGLLWLCAWEGVVPECWAWLAPALAPLVGTRMTVCAAGAALAWAWRWRRRPLKAVAVGAALGLVLAGVRLANQLLLGDPSLTAAFKANGITMAQLFDPSHALRGFFGMLIDQEYGLLPWAPVLVLAVAGLSAWVRRRDPLLLPALAWALPYMALLSCVPFWHGDMAPDRYLIVLVPLLALAAAEGHLALGRPAWGRLLLAAGWVLALVMQALPWFCFSKQQGESWPLRFAGSALGLRLTPAFPSFIINTPQSYLWALGLVLVAIWLAWRPALAGRHPH